jgi:hypothetical protein
MVAAAVRQAVQDLFHALVAEIATADHEERRDGPWGQPADGQGGGHENQLVHRRPAGDGPYDGQFPCGPHAGHLLRIEGQIVTEHSGGFFDRGLCHHRRSDDGVVRPPPAGRPCKRRAAGGPGPYSRLSGSIGGSLPQPVAPETRCLIQDSQLKCGGWCWTTLEVPQWPNGRICCFFNLAFTLWRAAILWPFRYAPESTFGASVGVFC